MTANEAVSIGDPIMIENSYDLISLERISHQLGNEFAEKLFQQDDNMWQGPIKSAYGLHLVFISKKNAEQFPEFEGIQDNLKYDLMYERKNVLLDKAYKGLKSRYTILVEGLPYE